MICTVAGTPPMTSGPVVITASTGATGEAVPADNTAPLTLVVLAPHAVPALGQPALLALAALLCLGYSAQARRRPAVKAR